MELVRTNEVVEYLIFEVDEDKIQEFIDLDFEYWTKYLATIQGFISKDVWINKSNPKEVHSLIYWNSLEEWKSIPGEDLVAVDKKFMAAFSGNFKLAREIHEEADTGLIRVGTYIK